jgi:Amt family ammonium transporter
MILWFGWFGFNGGSQFGISGDNLSVVGLCVVNTTLCPAAAVVTLTLLALALGEHTEIGDLLNGALGGLVSITANCNVVEPWAAVLIGIIGAFVYRYSSKLLIKLQIDDVINASPVHFFCGVWGLIATGLFAKPELGGMATHTDGLFYGGGKLLGWQVLGTLVITAWSVMWSGLFFGLLSKCDFLRVGNQVEKIGLDNYNKIAENCPDFGAGPNTPKGGSADVENPIAPGTPVVAARPIIQMNMDEHTKKEDEKDQDGQ